MSIYEIVITVLTIVFGGLSLYISAKKMVIDVVGGFIDKAEEEYKDATKAGGEKFEWVVTEIYNLIPVALKPFVSKNTIGVAVQKVFDIMESYAKKQLDKVVNKVIPTSSPAPVVAITNAENAANQAASAAK